MIKHWFPFLPFRLITLFTLLSTLFLSGCNADFTRMAEQRLEYARNNQGDIEIVAIRDLLNSDYTKGVLLAAEEINSRPEKLLGRALRVNIEQENETFEADKSTLRRIAGNPKITAVLGHRRSSIAVPASVIYERSQIIFMSSFSTAQSLTGHNFEYVFRMAPSNEVMSDQLANVAKTLGYQNIVILYARDDLSREMAFLFEDAAVKEGVNIIKKSSFFGKDTNYRSIISQFNSAPFDAIFISSSSGPGALMVKQLREMGVQKPILGNDSFNQSKFLNKAGKAAKNVIIPSLYKANGNNKKSQRFIQHYTEKYKKKPDFNAAQGYDSVMLLASGIEKAGSTIPSLLSSSLHYLPTWTGVTGIHAFSETGELLGKKYFFMALQNNHWQILPAIHIPYFLRRFQKSVSEKKDSPEHKVIDFSHVLSQRMHEDDHKIYLLHLAHEILNFNHIGIIFENTTNGRKAANYDLLKIFAKEKNVSVVECSIPFSTLKEDEIKRAMIACYGKLSLSADVLYMPLYHGMGSALIKQLTSSLRFFKIPAISLDRRNTDPNISLLLRDRSDIDLKSMESMQIFNGLLNGMKINEFAEKMKGLPEISVNIGNLQWFDLAKTAILKLSPDNYLISDNLPSKVPANP